MPRFPNANVANASLPVWVRNRPVADLAAQDRDRRRQWVAALGVDDMVRSIDTALRDTGRLQNTVEVFMSDNGLSFGAHRWPYKRCEYRECLGVPLMIRFPGRAGSTETQLVTNADIPASFAQLAGASPHVTQDGVSLLDVLRRHGAPTRDGILEHWIGGNDTQPRATTGNPTPGFYAIRTVGWRYVELVTGERELYDETTDPYEVHNLAGAPAYAGIQASLKAQLYRMEAASGVAPGPPLGMWRPTPADLHYVDLG
jgi:arylsulfatase A-like enzyme